MTDKEKKYSELEKILEKKQDEYLRKENVIGVGVGHKEVKGVDKGEPCLSVFVTQKLDEDLLSEEAIIEKTISDTEFKTDVVETGEVFAGVDPDFARGAINATMDMPAMKTNGEHRWGEEMTLTEEEGGVDIQALRGRRRPCEGGYSIGHYKVTSGTYGIVVYKSSEFPGVPTKFYILSNNHVLANSNDAHIGDPILQPARYDGGMVPRDIIARLSAYKRIEFSPPYGNGASNYIDAAIAEGQFHDLDREIYWIGYVNGTAEVKVGDWVQKTGRSTNYSTGKVRAVNATILVNYGNGRVARFIRQIITTQMSEGGDSGSLLCDMKNNAVGLLFANSHLVTIHNKIQYVQNILGIRIA